MYNLYFKSETLGTTCKESRKPPTNAVPAVLLRGILGLAPAVEDLTGLLLFFDIDGFLVPKFKGKTQILLQSIIFLYDQKD